MKMKKMKMKRKLSILLAGSVIAVALAGCGGTQTESSDVSDMSAESSAVSDVSTENSDVSEENVSSSDNTAESSADNAAESSESEEQSKYIQYSIITADISDEEIENAKTDFSKPTAFTVSSVNELNEFYKNNVKKYSLDKVDTGEDFKSLTADYDDNYFGTYSLVIILTKYKADTETDVGLVTLNNGSLNMDLYAEQPNQNDKTAYTCIITGFESSKIKGAKPVINLINSDGIAEDSEPV